MIFKKDKQYCIICLERNGGEIQMKYYKLLYDGNHGDEWIFLTFDESELPFNKYDIYESKRIPVTKIYCSIAECPHGDCDYLANDLSFLIVSEKVKTIFERFNLCDCQFIEVFEKGTERFLGYLVNCLEHYEALDEENARYEKFPDDPLIPLIVIRFAILEEKVKEKDFFQLQEDIFPYFISDRLKRALKKAHVIGFDFDQLIAP